MDDDRREIVARRATAGDREGWAGRDGAALGDVWELILRCASGNTDLQYASRVVSQRQEWICELIPPAGTRNQVIATRTN
jgi:hypothetical protein